MVIKFSRCSTRTKSKRMLCGLVTLILLSPIVLHAGIIAYDPFVNANVANAANDKVNGEYNAGSFFRDFTNGNNNNVAGGSIIGFSSANLWEGNSVAASQYIGPTDLDGLNFGFNTVQGGNAQARGFNSAGGVTYARRMLDSYTPSNTYYMSGLISCDKLSSNLNINAMMGFSTTISTGTFDGSSSFPGAIFGFVGDGSKVDLVVRHRNDASEMVNTTLLSDAQDNTVYFVVVKIEFDAQGSFEQLTAWLNPTQSSEITSTPAFTTTGAILTNTSQMTYCGFWLENFTSGLTDYIQFDEMRLGTEWADVVAVPDSGEILILSQNFSVPGDSFMRIDELNVAEVPQNPGFDVTPTGWKWGGYAAGYRVEIDQNTRGDVTFDELAFKLNPNDDYAYTIFSSSGTNEADTFVDMTTSWASMDFKISEIYAGDFGGMDNGSGLPAPANERYATVLRAMIRDANGQWFASDLFCPSTYEGTLATELDGTIVEYSLPFAGLTWHSYSLAENENLNALVGGDDIAINADPNVAEIAPDLTAVSGMGVYVWNAATWSAGQIAFTEISLKGQQLPVPPEYWDNDELGDMIADWLVSEVVWEETMDSDPAAGDNWVMRNDIAGDYVISDGEMVLLGNSYGNWRLDTNPEVNFAGTVTVNAKMKATTTSDTTEGSRSGINFWINLGTASIPYGSFNYSVVLDGANQYVEFISGWTEGVSWPPAGYTRVTGNGVTNFDSSMLDITLVIAPTEPNALYPDPTTFDLNYTIADQSGTTATGTLVVSRRDDGSPMGMATILTGGAQGVVDYIYINGEYLSAYDRTGDGFIDYEDFGWLADRWLTVREDPWP